MILSKNIFKNIAKKGEARSGLLLFTANLCASALGYFLNLILADKMNLEEFGRLRFLMDSAGYFFPVILLGFQYTSVQKILAANNEEKEKLTTAYILISSVMLVVFYFICNLILYLKDFGLFLGKYELFLAFSFFLAFPVFKDLAVNILSAKKKIGLLVLTYVIPQLILVILFSVSDSVLIDYAVFSIIFVNFIVSISFILISKISFKGLLKSVGIIISSHNSIGFPIYCASYVSLISVNLNQIISGVYISDVDYASLSFGLMFSGIVTLVPSVIGVIKFSDFCGAKRISNKVIAFAFFGMMGVSFLLAAIAIFINWSLDNKFSLMINLFPLMILQSLFQGGGDLINRFFFANAMGSTMSKVSFATGTTALILGLIFIPLFGAFGFVLAKTFSSIVFFCLIYMSYKKLTGNII